MINNKNAYTLRTETAGSATRYYISFVDGQSTRHETEVSHPVYLEFLRFARAERNLRRSDERHREQSDLSHETLFQRAFFHAQSIEETVEANLLREQVRLAIRDLPEAQRRRFILHHEYGLTYEQIAGTEGCSKMAVKYTIDKAEDAVRKKTKKYLK